MTARAALRRRRPRGDAGQAALEFVGTLPFVLLVGLAGLQLFFTLFTVDATNSAVRAAARANSLGQSASDAVSASLPTFLRGDVNHVDTNGETVTVQVDVPVLFPALTLPGFHVTRHATIPTT